MTHSAPPQLSPFARPALLLSACAALMLTAGCPSGNDAGPTGNPTAANPRGGGDSAGVLTLTAAGATFPYPLYSKWFDAYHQANAGVRINYQSIGSGGGIQQLKNKTVDFGASDAPLSDEEAREMPGPVVHLPTVGGAVVLAYNLPNGPADMKLSPEAVAGIFLGTVKKWDDPLVAQANGGAALPSIPVAVAHRSDGSGTSYIFTNYLAAVSPEWKRKVGAGKSVDWPVGLGGKGNEGVTGLVKQTPGSIGYVELAYALQNGLKYAWVKNKAGEFVQPTVESTTAAIEGAAEALAKDVRAPAVNAAGAKAYPIAGLTYILAYQEQANAENGRAFVNLMDWAIHDGQKLAPGLHYAPLPEAVAKLNEQALAKIHAGGQPLLASPAADAPGAPNAPAASNAP